MPKAFLKFLFKFFLLLVSLLFLLELGLRIYFYPPFDFLRVTEDDPYKWAQLPKNVKKTIRNKFRFALFKSVKFRYLVQTNSQRFRAEEDYELKPQAGVFRIICLGDSITFGWNLDYQYTYPALLEKELKRLEPNLRFQVINAGFPSYTSRQGLIYLDRELLNFHPDLILVQFGFNDSLPSWERMSGPIRLGNDGQVMAGAPGNWRPIKMGGIRALTRMVNNTVTGRFAMILYTMLFQPKRRSVPKGGVGSWAPPSEDSFYQNARVPLKDFRANLLEIYRLCQRHQIRMILIDPWGTPTEYRKAIQELARERGIESFSQALLMEEALRNLSSILSQKRYQPFLEKIYSRFEKDFLEKNSLFYLGIDWLHPSELGTIIFAEKLAEFILRPGSSSLEGH